MPKLILLYEDIMEEVESLHRKCKASVITPGKQKEIETCRKYIKNNWIEIIVSYEDAGVDWGDAVQRGG